jgi:hypothetical protein
MNFAEVGNAMLQAAEAAAGGTWNKIQHDFASDVRNVLNNAAGIEEQLRTGQLSEEEAEILLKNQSRLLFILSRKAIVDSKILVQNAVNAAIDVLWDTVKTAAKVI